MARYTRSSLVATIIFAVCVGQLRAEDAAAKIHFLNAREAAAAIVDESMEPYFSRLQTLEMIAKTGAPMTAADLSAQRDECRKRYQAAVDEFSDDEKAAITAVVQSIYSQVKDVYPLYANTPWSFLKVNPSIEGGMPHTRGANIVLSAPIAKAIVAMVASATAAGSKPGSTRVGELLVHEQSHVLQRARPALFADLYTNVWGLVRAKGLPSCPWLDKQQLINPDGPDVGWVLPAMEDGKQVYYQPQVILKEGVERPQMPQDFQVVGIVLDKKDGAFAPRLEDSGKPVQMPLPNVKAWSDVFGSVDENFHPNEIFAESFAAMVMKDQFGAKRDELPLFPKLREWCAKNFAGPAKLK